LIPVIFIVIIQPLACSIVMNFDMKKILILAANFQLFIRYIYIHIYIYIHFRPLEKAKYLYLAMY